MHLRRRAVKEVAEVWRIATATAVKVVATAVAVKEVATAAAAERTADPPKLAMARRWRRRSRQQSTRW